MPFRDPEVRHKCNLCAGPVYVDEPDMRECPDCRVNRAQIAAAHRQDAPGPRGPRVHRLLSGGRARQRGFRRPEE